MTIEAVAAGEASGRLESREMGVETLFTGFLAKKPQRENLGVSHHSIAGHWKGLKSCPPDW